MESCWSQAACQQFPCVYGGWSAAPGDVWGQARVSSNRKEQPPPLSLCILPSLKFFFPLFSIHLQISSICLHWWMDSALRHLAPVKIWGQQERAPTLFVPGTRAVHLKLLLHYPGSQNSLRCTPHPSRRVPDVGKEIELEKGAPGDLLSGSITSAALCDGLPRLHPTRREWIRSTSLDFQSLLWMRILVDNVTHFWEFTNSSLSWKPEGDPARKAFLFHAQGSQESRKMKLKCVLNVKGFFWNACKPTTLKVSQNDWFILNS